MRFRRKSMWKRDGLSRSSFKLAHASRKTYSFSVGVGEGAVNLRIKKANRPEEGERGSGASHRRAGMGWEIRADADSLRRIGRAC